MENKNKKYIKNILFGISLLPYAILIYMCICYAIGGYRYPGGEGIIYGFHAIGILLKNVFFIWFITFALLPYSLPIVLIIVLWIGYQIYYLITFKKSKSETENKIENKTKNAIKKTNFRKILFYIAIACWCLFFVYGISIFFSHVIIGKRILESFIFTLNWYLSAFTIIPILPISLLYIVIYVIVNKKKMS